MPIVFYLPFNDTTYNNPFLKKIDITGSTDAKKSLETGKYLLPQGSVC